MQVFMHNLHILAFFTFKKHTPIYTVYLISKYKMLQDKTLIAYPWIHINKDKRAPFEGFVSDTINNSQLAEQGKGHRINPLYNSSIHFLNSLLLKEQVTFPRASKLLLIT
jgi:hypothetical protein